MEQNHVLLLMEDVYPDSVVKEEGLAARALPAEVDTFASHHLLIKQDKC
jgi:hypothetical protein